MMHLCVVLVAMVMFTSSGACPESCYCFDDTFVTCSNFNMLDLAMLPHATDTLTLSSGDVDELPMGFLAMAKKLKLLEISKLRVSVVRQGAFRGLRNLEKISITDSTFDIVEPESFSGMNSIHEFEIISSQFGRVGRHAFSSIRNIRKFTIWLSSFGTLADEVFFKMQDVRLFQLYTSNISYVGKDIFKGANRVEEATFYSNSIHSLVESSLAGLFESSKKVSVYRNVFTCSCDLSWALGKPDLLNNVCVVPGQSFSVHERSFQLRDMTEEALCAIAQETQTVTEEQHNEPIDGHFVENRPPEISQNFGEAEHASAGNSSQSQILPVVEAFDEDLTIIDQVLFENILPPTPGEPNATRPDFRVDNERYPDRVDGLLGQATNVHKRISLLGGIEGEGNTTSHMVEDVTEIIPEVFIQEIGEKIITEDHEDRFETGDTSTEDERAETFSIVGEYIKVTTTPPQSETSDRFPAWRDPLEHPVSSEEPSTEGTIVSWEQESVYFDQKTPLSSSENEGFESENSVGESSSFIGGPDDEDNDVDADDDGDGDDGENDSSPATKVVIDKLALAISGRVGERQGSQSAQDGRTDDQDTKAYANMSVHFRASLLCALASCLFCILHWLVLV